MKKHLQKERELNDTPYGLRVLTQGTADLNLQKKAPKRYKPKRQKREEHDAEAVAHLDSFFSEVSGLQKKTQIEEKPVHVKNVAEKMSRENETFENAFDKSSRSGKKNSMPPVTQETLNHKNCFALEEESKFNSIWMGSDADWTTLNIHLGMDPEDSLKQAEKALEHYRTKLNDFWNIHGLTAGQGYGVDGQPWCTSHYSFHLVLWHIPLALSGQRYDAVRKVLTLEPRLKVPYALPFFTPFASGTVKARKLDGRTKYIVIVTSGRLNVKLLAVSKSMLPKDHVDLRQGEYVSWERK